jgi:ABC-2 type transport system ATP-binding protein
VIQVNDLTRYYGERRAVDAASFTIGANEVVGFLGLNGAGKTTTLKVLAGLLLPSAGTVTFDGHDVATSGVAMRSQIGFLPEDPPLYLEMVVRDFIRFVGGLRGMSGADLDARLPGVLAKTQLTEVADRVIGELSHGFRKRVGIAQAIIHHPRLVILDEPISGLDPVQIVEMRKVILGLKAESTVLVSSHILSEISQTCDRILVLNEGRLVAHGTEQELAGRFHIGGSVDLSLRDGGALARKILEGCEGVKKVILIGESEDFIDVRVSMSGDVREDLVAALVDGGVGVRRVDSAHDELEEIFLDLTRPGAVKVQA